MNKTKIEWCDSTWNPVTGCLHGCPYCYARGIAKRFGNSQYDDGKIHTRDDLYKLDYAEFHELAVSPYPFGFSPTLHRNERFGWHSKDPSKVKKPQKIFVCSMADLFGEWVPDEWIKAVFEACEAAPQHTYLFLTKNPGRYNQYYSFRDDRPANFYFGASATNYNDMVTIRQTLANSLNFLSLEPIHSFVDLGKFTYENPGHLDWVIIGAETGNRKDKVTPKREWIENVLEQCKATSTPIFMKNSLADIWGEPLIQQWPEGMK